jgi:predicted ester cyclase
VHKTAATSSTLASEIRAPVPDSVIPARGAGFAGIFNASSDFRPEIKEQIAEGGRVVTHALFLGTNDDELMGCHLRGER